MSDKAQLWADQTLNTGVLQGVSREALSEAAKILTAMGVGWFDIQWTAWRKYASRLAEFAFAGRARCIVDTSLEQTESAWQAGFGTLVVTYTLQRWRSSSNDLEQVLAYAQEKRMVLSLHIVNASELEAEVIRSLFPLLIKYEVKSLIIGDRDSRLEPLQTCLLLKDIADGAPCMLAFHAHNSVGLATANAYAAVRAGAAELAVAVAGIGSCGHAALEEVVLAAKCLAGQDLDFPSTLAADCAAVLAYLGYEPPSNKAVIGQHIFSHESGIHVNGMAKDQRLYEAFLPEMVGLTRRMVIGKHSGTTSLKTRFEEWGMPLDERTAKALLKKIRRMAVSKKSVVEDMQLKRIYYRMLRRSSMKMSPWEATYYE